MTPSTAGHFTSDVVEPSPFLDGYGVRLRPITAADIDDIFDACRDSETIKWTTIPTPYLRKYAKQFVRQLPRYIWAITVPEFGERWCGSIELRVFEGEDKNPNLGYMMAPWARGRGSMTGAVQLLRDHVFALGHECLEIHAYPDNVGSRRVAEKAGFTYQGLIEKAELQRGVLKDCVVYTATAAEKSR